MTAHSAIDGLKLLIVDDEPDILETMVELLDRCNVDTAHDYETAAEMLHQNQYDAAIFDIMGVQGFDLLIIANKKKMPSLMLTDIPLGNTSHILAVKSVSLASEAAYSVTLIGPMMVSGEVSGSPV